MLRTQSMQMMHPQSEKKLQRRVGRLVERDEVSFSPQLASFSLRRTTTVSQLFVAVVASSGDQVAAILRGTAR
jgi:hypothetical protein